MLNFKLTAWVSLPVVAAFFLAAGICFGVRHYVSGGILLLLGLLVCIIAAWLLTVMARALFGWVLTEFELLGLPGNKREYIVLGTFFYAHKCYMIFVPKVHLHKGSKRVLAGELSAAPASTRFRVTDKGIEFLPNSTDDAPKT